MDPNLLSEPVLRQIAPNSPATTVRNWAELRSNAQPSFGNKHNGPISLFYSLILQNLAILGQMEGLESITSVAKTQNELTRLRLWSAEVNMDLIDQALNLSGGLKTLIMQRLVDIARLILQGNRQVEGPIPSSDGRGRDLVIELERDMNSHSSVLLQTEDSNSSSSDESSLSSDSPG